MYRDIANNHVSYVLVDSLTARLLRIKVIVLSVLKIINT